MTSRCPTSSAPTSVCCSSASTRGCGPRRARPTSPIPATDSTRRCCRRGSSARDIDRSDGMTDADRSHLIGRGIGITNVVHRTTAKASELDTAELRPGGDELRAFVAEHRPAWSRSPASPRSAPRFGYRRPRWASNSATSRAPGSGSCRTRAGSTHTKRSNRSRRRIGNLRRRPASSDAGGVVLGRRRWITEGSVAMMVRCRNRCASPTPWSSAGIRSPVAPRSQRSRSLADSSNERMSNWSVSPAVTAATPTRRSRHRRARGDFHWPDHGCTRPGTGSSGPGSSG